MAVASKSRDHQSECEHEHRVYAPATALDDWPGASEFADLGALYRQGCVAGVVTIGFFRAASGGSSVVYVASSCPHVVGMGAGEHEAFEDWLHELVAKWEIAKSIRRPFAPAVENDIDEIARLLRAFEGGATNA